MTSVAIVAGEASGDMHAAALLEELLRMRPGVECFGLGGAHMERLGVRLLYHVRDLAVVGF